MSKNNERESRDDPTDHSDSERPFRIDRRLFLTEAGALGVGAMGSAGASDDDASGTETGSDGQDGDGDASNSQFAVKEHDHSGEYGESSRLGREAPVESISVADLASRRTPLVDVRSYGAVGDGEMDDSDAFRKAVEAATPHGVLYVPYNVLMRLESPVEIDLGGSTGQNRFAFICHGAIRPAPGIGDAITIRNGRRPYAFVRIQGGGKDIETDTAVRVEGGGAGLFEGQAEHYDGTVYTIEDSGTYSIGFLRTSNCGQSLAVYDASPMGEFRDGFDVAPVRAPEFHDSSDICINQYENFVGGNCEQGLLFDDCLSIFADRIAVGGTAEVPIFEIRDSWNACFNALHLGGARGVGARIENTTDTNFQIFSHINEVGVEYTGKRTARNRIVMNALSVSDTAVRITEDVTGGYHHIAGNIAGNSDIGVDVRSADADVRLDGLECVGNDLDLKLPAGDNEVHVHNSKIGSIQGRPRTYNHVGIESAAADLPDANRWDVGSTVLFTDTDDGSGDGLYFLVTDDTWYRVEGSEHQVETVELRVAQPDRNWVPEFTTEEHLDADGTYGQTFTIDRPVDSIETAVANFQNPDSAATMSLYRGSPLEDNLEEVASARLDPWGPDNQWVTWDLQSEESGVFYLEMSDPVETPTWWAYMLPSGTQENLADVGGQGFIDRVPIADALDDVDAANFTIKVFG